MLTAFTYYDPEEEGRIQHGMKDNVFFAKEKNIVLEFAGHHHGIWRPVCPSCGSEDVWPVFERLGIRYEGCSSCGTLFAGVKDEEVEAYFAQPDLCDLRLSPKYQAHAGESRSRRWGEILDWLKFRAFRYLGKNSGLCICDYGNRWQEFAQMIKESSLCAEYEIRDSLLVDACETDASCGSMDMVLAFSYLERCTNPRMFFCEAWDKLREGGLLVFSIKAGNGFDILKLRGKNPSLLPFEHNFLPSREGIETLLYRTSFELLEYTTPGTFDLNYVMENKDGLGKEDYFLRYFLEHAESNALAEFQRFLQRSGMSSHAQLIARKKVGK